MCIRARGGTRTGVPAAPAEFSPDGSFRGARSRILRIDAEVGRWCAPSARDYYEAWQRPGPRCPAPSTSLSASAPAYGSVVPDAESSTNGAGNHTVWCTVSGGSTPFPSPPLALRQAARWAYGGVAGLAFAATVVKTRAQTVSVSSGDGWTSLDCRTRACTPARAVQSCRS